MARRQTGYKPRRTRTVRFTIQDINELDYKNVGVLQKFLTDSGKILSRRVTGLNAKEQRALTSAVKQARYLGLISVASSKSR